MQSEQDSVHVHPLGTRAKVLLVSVFGPYAQDDDYGSRAINPMELYHNQVTKVQGGFSLRMFHRSFGLMMIQSNIDAPCTLLDFPTRERFIREIRDNSYDIVGIGSIVPNIGKVKDMCDLVRRYLPAATIVVGGHVTGLNDLADFITVDHVVKGDGIRWFRRYLGQDEGAPIRHPLVYSGSGARIMGLTLRGRSTAATLIPSVGCPVGCNFCSTSALFGGKGHFVDFFKTGDEIFSVMCQIEEQLKVASFFVQDENFLLHRTRALRLLELMQQHGKSWSIYVFTSGEILRSYTIEQLVGLGVAWVWMGLEGEDSQYQKVRDVDTHSLVGMLQSNGIRVLGSSIIGLENHTLDNVGEVIDYAVRHCTDFHQFMLYMPVPCTPLYMSHQRDGSLLPPTEFALADTHGQFRFNYRHKHIPQGREEQILFDAFQRDFEVNGPSLLRLIRTILTGWRTYKNHPERRIRERLLREVRPLRSAYAGALWAMMKWYRSNQSIRDKVELVLNDIYAEFGWRTRLMARLIGPLLYVTLKLEERRLARGWTYEPQTFYEKNPAAMACGRFGRAARNRWVVAKG